MALAGQEAQAVGSSAYLSLVWTYSLLLFSLDNRIHPTDLPHFITYTSALPDHEVQLVVLPDQGPHGNPSTLYEIVKPSQWPKLAL